MLSVHERLSRLEAVVAELTYALEELARHDVAEEVLAAMSQPAVRDELLELVAESAPNGHAAPSPSSESQTEDRRTYLRGLAAKARSKKRNLSDEARERARAEARACGVPVGDEL